MLELGLEIQESTIICGIDEAGRGPLAGPVAAAAVVLPNDFPLEILADSKKLSLKKREEAFRLVKAYASWSLAWASHNEIDSLNILRATMLAMQRAYSALDCKFEIALVDGNCLPDLPCRARTIIKGDSKIPQIMAASIIAKVSRDNLMLEYDELYPEYGYRKHKGYATREHIKACLEFGPSPIQRLSFSYRTERAGDRLPGF